MPQQLIITFRTDKPEAELGVYRDGHRVAYQSWHAHRELAETIHRKLDEILSGTNQHMKDVTGVICYQGPGSFTGLRIGISVANALAYGLAIPIVATRDEHWIQDGINRLGQGKTDFPVQPHYGVPVHITAQKK